MKKSRKILGCIFAVGAACCLMMQPMKVYAQQSVARDFIAKQKKVIVQQMKVEPIKEEIQSTFDLLKLCGVWETTIDLSDLLDLGEEFGDFNEPFEVKLVMEFEGSGEFHIYMDEEAFMQTVDEWMSELVAVMVEDMYEEYAQQGISRALVDKAVKQQYGMDLNSYLLKNIREELSMEDITGENRVDGTYEVKDDQLYLYEGSGWNISKECFDLEGNTLTFLESEGADSEYANIYPIVFTRMSEDGKQ
ncbi:MAG: hypothetical protein ACI4AA_03075 [Lachnospiraceae bacterium]